MSFLLRSWSNSYMVMLSAPWNADIRKNCLRKMLPHKILIFLAILKMISFSWICELHNRQRCDFFFSHQLNDLALCILNHLLFFLLSASFDSIYYWPWISDNWYSAFLVGLSIIRIFIFDQLLTVFRIWNPYCLITTENVSTWFKV